MISLSKRFFLCRCSVLWYCCRQASSLSLLASFLLPFPLPSNCNSHWLTRVLPVRLPAAIPIWNPPTTNTKRHWIFYFLQQQGSRAEIATGQPRLASAFQSGNCNFRTKQLPSISNLGIIWAMETRISWLGNRHTSSIPLFLPPRGYATTSPHMLLRFPSRGTFWVVFLFSPYPRATRNSIWGE